VALDIHRQIPASFERVQRSEYGYNAKQVDQFLQRARVSLESPHDAGQPINSSDVRAVSFDPVKGGYSAAVVDAALDRLCHELVAYLEHDKPLSVDSVRRAVFRPETGRDGYEEAQVDAFLDRVIELMAAID